MRASTELLDDDFKETTSSALVTSVSGMHRSIKICDPKLY